MFILTEYLWPLLCETGTILGLVNTMCAGEISVESLWKYAAQTALFMLSGLSELSLIALPLIYCNF
jgi:hypothetical protein